MGIKMIENFLTDPKNIFLHDYLYMYFGSSKQVMCESESIMIQIIYFKALVQIIAFLYGTDLSHNLQGQKLTLYTSYNMIFIILVYKGVLT